MKKFIVKKTDLFDGKNFYAEGSTIEADENDEDVSALILSGNLVADVEAELKAKADEDERLMKEAEEKEKAKSEEENKIQVAPDQEEPVKEEAKDQNQGRKKNRN